MINIRTIKKLAENDGLTLRELDSALLSTQQYMTEKFEFIGFDACLMGNVEAANILANYANYMYGSEELEPGCGWNYVEIGNYLAQNPGASGADLGPIVCDSFYKGCQEIGDSDVCTLACIDLSKMDDVVKSFNTFAKLASKLNGVKDERLTVPFLGAETTRLVAIASHEALVAAGL